MQVRDRYANEHTALKWFRGKFTGQKKGWLCSLDFISKVYHYYWHQKTKLKVQSGVKSHMRESISILVLNQILAE